VTRAVSAAVVLALLAAAAAFAATPKPDAHDRALARHLDAKVKTFRDIASQTGSSNDLKQSLNRCPLLKKDPGQAFAALFALLPALMTQLVNDYGPQLRDLRGTMAGMHPHAKLFRSWLGAEGQSLALILRFDNHGKKIDLCEAATVMLDKKTTAADIQRTLGIDPTLIAALFQSPASAKLTKLDPPMRTFLVRAGLSKADAKALTS
jgi:hypothetical protein